MTHAAIAARALQTILRRSKLKPSEYIAIRKARAAVAARVAATVPAPLPVIDETMIPKEGISE